MIGETYDPSTLVATPRLQPLFDAMFTAVYKQGLASMRTSRAGQTTCAYRGLMDTKCAIGHIMPDEMYRPYFEGKSICTLMTDGYAHEILPGPPPTRVERQILSEMQSHLHDAHSRYRGREFRDRLIESARHVSLRFKLAMPTIPALEGTDA